MVSQEVKTGKADSTYTDYKQIKIYGDGYMMYAGYNPADSVSGFGIGTYTVSMDTVTESILYNASDTSFSENPGQFSLVIEKTIPGYKQVISGMKSNSGDTMQLTEIYDSVGTPSASALDGAWQQVKSYTIKGADTSSWPIHQFKTYGLGHFIWGHSYQDSAKHTHSGVGFGTFQLDGNNLVEKLNSSSYSQSAGKDYNIGITMNGSDGFTQMMVNADSSKSYEVYQRIKK